MKVDVWGPGGWTVMIGGCSRAWACVCASAWGPTWASGAGEGRREGGGYGKCLGEAILARARVPEVLGLSFASRALVEILAVLVDRRGAMVDV